MEPPQQTPKRLSFAPLAAPVLIVRIKIRGLFYRYGRQNRDLTTYRMSILASEGIEPLFRLERRAHHEHERPRAT